MIEIDISKHKLIRHLKLLLLIYFIFQYVFKGSLIYSNYMLIDEGECDYREMIYAAGCLIPLTVTFIFYISTIIYDYKMFAAGKHIMESIELNKKELESDKVDIEKIIKMDSDMNSFLKISEKSLKKHKHLSYNMFIVALFDIFNLFFI